MLRVLLLALLLLTSCSHKRAEIYINAELQPYVDSFLIHGVNLGRPVYISSLIADFGYTAEDDAGTCYDDPVLPIITIDKLYWETLNPSAKEILMYHELGHCVLGRGHNLTLDDTQAPVSIMYKSLFSYKHYETNRLLFLTELFHGG